MQAQGITNKVAEAPVVVVEPPASILPPSRREEGAVSTLSLDEVLLEASDRGSSQRPPEISELQEAAEEVAKRIEEVVRSLQRDLHFEVHKETGILYVKVTDARDGKVLRELPMKELLDTLARLDKIAGLFLDGKA
ncbi:MAG: flagellar protein FlaG [candidate division KSB1 bacterium]|nr:flagellar protein FlaG [candidate division KSB1 bacterium]